MRYPLTVLIILALLLVGCYRAPTFESAGGVRLIYEVDQERMLAEDQDTNLPRNVEQIQDVLDRRMRRFGSVVVEVKSTDPPRIEVGIVGAQQADLPEIKRLIAARGDLALLIVANQIDDAELIEAARESEATSILNAEGEEIGHWVAVDASGDETRPFGTMDSLRAKNKEGEYVAVEFTIEQYQLIFETSVTTKQLLKTLELDELQMLLRVDPNPNRRVTGAHLRSASVGADNVGRPAIRFYMSAEGAKRLGVLSQRNLPDDTTGFHRRMAIVFNGEVISAPSLNDMISDSGIITGEFTHAEVESMVAVLNAGRMPVPLKPEPIGETWLPPR